MREKILKSALQSYLDWYAYNNFQISKAVDFQRRRDQPETDRTEYYILTPFCFKSLSSPMLFN